MTKVGRDGVLVGSHKKDVMVLSLTCVLSQGYETTLMGGILERVFCLNYHFGRLKVVNGVSNKKPVY